MPDFPSNPFTNRDMMIELLRRGGKFAAPNATSLMQGEPDPNQNFSMQPYPSGKLPQQSDPRIEGAGLEAGNLGSKALGLLGGGAGMVEDLASSFGSTPANAAPADKKPQGKAAKGPAIPPGAIAPEPPAEPEAVPGGGRPAYTREDIQRLNEIQAEIKRLTANPGDSPKTTRQTIQGLQQEESDIRNNMRTLQTAYDKQGQPISMRDPATVDALRMGAFKLAGAHGAARGLLKKNPIVTALTGGLEALGGAGAPTFLDLFQPPDTQARKQAVHNLTDPDYYKQVVAPDVLFGGGALSTIGHGLGRTTRELGDQTVGGAKKFLDWRRSLKGGPGGPGEPTPPPGGGPPGGMLPESPELDMVRNGPSWELPDMNPASPKAITSVLRKDTKGRAHKYPLFGDEPAGRFARGQQPPANE